MLKESEEKFKTLAEESPNMIFINKQGRVVYANEKCEKITGYKRKEFYSPHFDFLTLIAPEYHERVRSSFARHLRGEEVEPYEYALVPKDGRRVEVLLSTKLIDYEGERAILGILTDITDRKRAEAALRESEEKYRTVVESSYDIIFTVDLKGNFLFTNKAFENVLGYSNREIEEINGFELVHPEDLETVKQRFAELIRGQRQHNLEYRYRTKNGAYISILSNASPVFDSQGSVVAASGIARDVTQLKRVETALRESEEKWRSLYTSMKEGVAIHEVVCDESGKVNEYIILDVNPSYETIIGLKKEHAVGRKASELYGTDQPPYLEIYARVAASGQPTSFETYFPPMDKHFSISVFSPRRGWFATVFTDITERKRAEEALQQAHEELELRVEKRTAELVQSKKQLEEVNTALRVLLKRREADKGDLEENVLSNIKDLVLPYLEKLKKTSLDGHQSSCVSILESNLNHIVSPFSRRLSSKYLGLTPTEIRVANLVKDGMTTKEIAGFMNLSGKTVETHRDNIRKKIGIKHKKTNLSTYLSSLQ